MFDLDVQFDNEMGDKIFTPVFHTDLNDFIIHATIYSKLGKADEYEQDGCDLADIIRDADVEFVKAILEGSGYFMSLGTIRSTLDEFRKFLEKMPNETIVYKASRLLLKEYDA